jgi:hypothetical protein
MLSADPLPRSHRRARLRRQCRGLQDQSAFLRITSLSPSTPVPPGLLVSLAANCTDAPYAGISDRPFCPAGLRRRGAPSCCERHGDKLEGLLVNQLLRPDPQWVGVRPAVKQHRMRMGACIATLSSQASRGRGACRSGRQLFSQNIDGTDVRLPVEQFLGPAEQGGGDSALKMRLAGLVAAEAVKDSKRTLIEPEGIPGNRSGLLGRRDSERLQEMWRPLLPCLALLST